MKKKYYSNVPRAEEGIYNVFLGFLENTYGDEEFPQFEAAERFFQYFFNTKLRLNDFKNLQHELMLREDFESVGKKQNPKTKRPNNYFKLKR